MKALFVVLCFWFVAGCAAESEGPHIGTPLTEGTLRVTWSGSEEGRASLEWAAAQWNACGAALVEVVPVDGVPVYEVPDLPAPQLGTTHLVGGLAQRVVVSDVSKGRGLEPSVIAHELGHALGLQHSAGVMTWSFDAGVTYYVTAENCAEARASRNL